MAPKPSSKGSRPKGSSSARSPSSAKTKKPAYKPRKRDEVMAKRPAATSDARKKRRQYSEKELNIPKLNMITPAGVQKPKGKKKGKVFVDDQESMMTILAMVHADKEGQIESKMMRARQMEDIREARQKEQEKRQTEKKGKLVGAPVVYSTILCHVCSIGKILSLHKSTCSLSLLTHVGILGRSKRLSP